MSYFDDHENDIIYGRRGTPHRDSIEGRPPRMATPPSLPPPNGFREFSQQKAPVDAHHLDLLRRAKVYVVDEWETEFYNSIRARVLDSHPLTPRQLEVLEKMASGELAEARERREAQLDEGSAEPMPSQAAGGLDGVRDDDIPF